MMSTEMKDREVAPIKKHNADFSKPLVSFQNCEVCVAGFESTDDMKSHVEFHNPRVCVICDKVFSTHANLVQHMRGHSVRAKFSFSASGTHRRAFHTCRSCLTGFQCTDDLENHLCWMKPLKKMYYDILRKGNAGISNDQLIIKGKGSKVSFRCCHCPKKFETLAILCKHIRVHIGEPMFYCAMCRERFTRFNYNKHLITVHSAMRPHICPKCNKTFYAQNNLRRHIRLVHKGRVPNISREVRKNRNDGAHKIDEFSIAQTPFQYEQTPYQYEKDGGDLGSLSNSELISVNDLEKDGSVQRLSGTVQYQCHICPKAFSDNKRLRNHLKLHKRQIIRRNTTTPLYRKGSLPNSYHCNICNKMFLAIRSVFGHLRMHKVQSRDIYKNEITESGSLSPTLKKMSTEGLEVSSSAEAQYPRTFSCKKCPRSFNHIKGLNAHMKSHQGENGIKKYDYPRCPICRRTFSSIKSVNSHIKKVHKKRSTIPNQEKLFSCSFCSKQFDTMSGLKGHIRIHKVYNAPGIFSCTYCSRVFSFRTSLYRHQISVHGVERSSKSYSGSRAQTFSIKNKTAVMSSYHNTDMTLDSELASDSSNSSDYHQANSYGVPPQNTNDNITNHNRQSIKSECFSCPTCNGTFHSNHELRKHLETHVKLESNVNGKVLDKIQKPGNMLVKKEIGRIKVSTNSSMHIKNKSNLEPTPLEPEVNEEGQFVCPVCKKTFASRASFASHAQVHSQERTSYHCRFCPKKFTHSSSRKVHEKSHVGDLKYKCSYCGVKYATAARRRVHERTHTGELPYPCPICLNRFATKASCIQHLGTHSKLFKCQMCKEGFATLGYLKSHMHSFHKIEKQELGEKKMSQSIVPIHCLLCDEPFTTAEALQQHLNGHIVKIPTADNSRDSDGNTSHYSTSTSEKDRTETSQEAGPFSCPKCQKTFTKKSSLKGHMGSHSRNNTEFNCRFCPMKTTKQYNLARHEETHFMGNLRVSEIEKLQSRSSKSSPDQSLMFNGDTPKKATEIKVEPDTDNGMRNISKEKINGRNNSKDKLVPQQPLNGGIKTEEHTNEDTAVKQEFSEEEIIISDEDCGSDVEEIYMCSICDKEFGSAREVDLHMDTHQENITADVVKIFEENLESANQHTESQQGNVSEDQDSTETRRKFVSEDNSNSSSKDAQQEKIPDNKETMEIDPEPVSVNNINIYDSQESASKYPCQTCGKIFQSAWKLRRHLNIHRIDRPLYPCRFCPKKMTEDWSRKAHEKLHSKWDRRKKKLAYPSLSLERKKKIQKPQSKKERSYFDGTSVGFSDMTSTAGMGIISIKKEPTDMQTDSFVEPPEALDTNFEKTENILNDVPVQSSLADSDIKSLIEVTDCEQLCDGYQNVPKATIKIKKELLHVDNAEDLPSFTKEKISQSQMNSINMNNKTCNVCGKRFSHMYRLKRHMNIHLENRPMFPCRYCPKKMTESWSRDDHEKLHFKHFKETQKRNTTVERFNTHKPQPSTGFVYPCPLCGADFLSREDVQNHLKKHMALNQMQKSEPKSKKLAVRSKNPQGILHSQNQKVSNSPMYRCNVCNIDIYSTNELQRHMCTKERPGQNSPCDSNEDYVDDSLKFKCSECPVSFGNSVQLVRHKQSHQEEQMPALVSRERSNISDRAAIEGDQGPFVCRICNKSFLYIYRLKSHSVVHTTHKPFSCSECGKSFKRKYDLTSHERSHVGKLYKCSFCSVQYTSEHTLKIHQIRAHGSKVPYKNVHHSSSRNAVKPKFTTPADNHSSSILASEPSTKQTKVPSRKLKHVCSICNKRFLKAKYLQRHIRFSHIDTEKSHTCQICSHSFQYGWMLKRHMKAHGGTFVCQVCGAHYKSRQGLTCHVKSHKAEDVAHSASNYSNQYSSATNSELYSAFHQDPKFVGGNYNSTYTKREAYPREYRPSEISASRNPGSDLSSDEEELYMCNLCDTVFSSSSSLEAHITSHHS